MRELFDFWPKPAIISKNNFVNKSLSNWSFNIAVGCSHGCRFCYVPGTSVNKQAEALEKYGVSDPDGQWGEYSLLRLWDERIFLKSLKSAQETPADELNLDGNRAVILSSTTDPFQAFKNANPAMSKQLTSSAFNMVKRALELILKNSDLNVRILTRNPMAEKLFPLFKLFGNRLMFGMSVPTLNDALAEVFEPGAPPPSHRYATLLSAQDQGLHIFTALAPTYPYSDETDIKNTLEALKALNPVTIYSEPINVRAKNIQRIIKAASDKRLKLNTRVFDTDDAWLTYTLESLHTVERLSATVGVGDRLHLWPDKRLILQKHFDAICRFRSENGDDYPASVNFNFDLKSAEDRQIGFEQHTAWIEKWWGKISDWPDREKGRFSTYVPSIPLTSSEKQTFANHEKTIASGWDTFLAVGRALKEIRDNKLFRDRYASFPAYCRIKWNYGKSYSYRLIAAAGVAEKLSPRGDIFPQSEAQIRPLAGLSENDIKRVWSKAIEIANGKNPTPKQVKKALGQIFPKSADTETETQVIPGKSDLLRDMIDSVDQARILVQTGKPVADIDPLLAHISAKLENLESLARLE